VAGFALLGYWIDRHYGSQPWGLLTGLVLGIVGGLYNMVSEALRATREAQQDDKTARGGTKDNPDRAADGE
jgi:F0F1-type ATP synthase assembly protein I